MKTRQTIGRYRVEGLVGTGAMGEVYRAYDPVIDRPVAIKVLRPELIAGSGSEQWLQRFRREARAAGRRFHPNIVAIWDFGDDNGTPFLAMEFVDGRSLDDLIKSSGPFEPGRSVAIIAQVLSALGFAHQNGIVHRDVKPSNIMVLQNGDVKVADFGIARIDASEFTIVGDLLGTPAYMAPEQLSGAPVDHRTDLFAAGVILFEMLTGVKPFRGKSITEIMKFMETRGPEDIRALNPAVPDTLKLVIAKSVAFDPAERYRDAAELSAAIFEAVPALSGGPQGREPSAPEAPISEPGTAPTARSTQTVPADASLHPDLLREIERDLATFIGPMASIALKRAVSQTNDILALYDLLGGQVNNPRDRAEFLARGRQRAALGRGGLRSSAPLKPGLATERKSDNPTVPPSVANIRAIEADLTRYIGPIAKILVKRELGKFQTLAKFCHVLSAHIPDERDRRAFLNAHGGD
jgi:eukaryotic-like serine/threonine-protein kinase